MSLGWLIHKWLTQTHISVQDVTVTGTRQFSPNGFTCGGWGLGFGVGAKFWPNRRGFSIRHISTITPGAGLVSRSLCKETCLHTYNFSANSNAAHGTNCVVICKCDMSRWVSTSSRFTQASTIWHHWRLREGGGSQTSILISFLEPIGLFSPDMTFTSYSVLPLQW